MYAYLYIYIYTFQHLLPFPTPPAPSFPPVTLLVGGIEALNGSLVSRVSARAHAQHATAAAAATAAASAIASARGVASATARSSADIADADAADGFGLSPTRVAAPMTRSARVQAAGLDSEPTVHADVRGVAP